MVVKIKRKFPFYITLGSILMPTVFVSATESVPTKTKDNKIPIPGHFNKAPGTITTDGENGTIFQAKNGDLYVMGKGTGLEVLKDGASEFVSAPGTKTTDGERGTIFQAKNGDLYVMGKGTGLEVLKNDTSRFVSAPGTEITDGSGGTIFQAQNGDLYVMGNGSELEVLKNDASKFVSAPGTKTTDGEGGTIFQAKNGDLYVMGFRKGLEVLKNDASEFVSAPGTKTTDGEGGTIFQAQNGDLYVMGAGVKLEVLKNDASEFVSAPGSKINDGRGGTIFQAQNGDLYVMGFRKGLEVLKNDASEFVSAPGTKITDGSGGTIFQAQNGDLYVMAYGARVEVLKNDASEFVSAPGSKINNGGYYGTIFQAQNGDLYVMGDAEKLEVLKNDASEFVSAPGTKITDGYGGTIFQAQNGDLYVMGSKTGLEVLKNNSTLSFVKTDETAKDKNDGTITVTNGTDVHSQLQYKLADGSTWTNVPDSGKITDLAPGTYQFQWKSKNGEQYVGENSTTKVISKTVIIDPETKIAVPTTVPVFNKTDETAKGKNDGTITVTNGTNVHSQLQYKLADGSTWTNVPDSGKITGLAPGTYQFQWKSKNGEQYVGENSTTKAISKTVIIAPETKIAVPATVPVFNKTDETAKDKNDGTITVTNGTDTHSQLQYKLADGSTWTNVPDSGKITGLAPGTYQFQWVGKNGEQYVGGISISKTIAKKINIKTKIAVPTTVPVFNKTDETAKDKNDGTITVTNGTDTHSQLQYKLADGSTWTNVPNSGKITSLAPGTYQFQWKSKNDEQYVNTNKTTINISKKEIVIKPKKIVSSNNLTIILATTIPIAFAFILAIILSVKYKPFRSNKK